jgi:hypothetical protein
MADGTEDTVKLWIGRESLAKVKAYQNTDNAAEMYDINIKVLKGKAMQIKNERDELRLLAERRVDQQYSSPPPAAPASAPPSAPAPAAAAAAAVQDPSTTPLSAGPKTENYHTCFDLTADRGGRPSDAEVAAEIKLSSVMNGSWNDIAQSSLPNICCHCTTCDAIICLPANENSLASAFPMIDFMQATRGHTLNSEDGGSFEGGRGCWVPQCYNCQGRQGRLKWPNNTSWALADQHAQTKGSRANQRGYFIAMRRAAERGESLARTTAKKAKVVAEEPRRGGGTSTAPPRSLDVVDGTCW